MFGPKGNTARPIVISFSGLDGSGKSTQIDNARTELSALGYRVKVLAFWDDVVVATRYRERFVHKVYGSEQGIGSPNKPVTRRDKNVRAWYLNLARHGLYLLDAINLRRVLRKQRDGAAQIVIMDRYIYDEFANLPLRNVFSRFFIRMIAKHVVPQPDLALLLDADPDAARARKPEYPLEFMRECRTWYYRLASLVGGVTIIPPLELDAVKAAVMAAISGVLQVHSAANPSLRYLESA